MIFTGLAGSAVFSACCKICTSYRMVLSAILNMGYIFRVIFVFNILQEPKASAIYIGNNMISYCTSLPYDDWLIVRWTTLSDYSSADNIAEFSAWCRNFCPPKLFVQNLTSTWFVSLYTNLVIKTFFQDIVFLGAENIVRRKFCPIRYSWQIAFDFYQ